MGKSMKSKAKEPEDEDEDMPTLAQVIFPPGKGHHGIHEENRMLTQQARIFIRWVCREAEDIPLNVIAEAFETNVPAIKKVLSNTYNKRRNSDHEEINEERYKRKSRYKRIREFLDRHHAQILEKADEESMDEDEDEDEDEEEDEEDSVYVFEDDSDEEGPVPPVSRRGLKARIIRSETPSANTRAKTPKPVTPSKRKSLPTPPPSVNSSASLKRRQSLPSASPPKRRRFFGKGPVESPPEKGPSAKRQKTSPAEASHCSPHEVQRQKFMIFFDRALGFRPSYLNSLFNCGFGPDELLMLKRLNEKEMTPFLELPPELRQFPVKVRFLAKMIVKNKSNNQLWKILETK